MFKFVTYGSPRNCFTYIQNILFSVHFSKLVISILFNSLLRVCFYRHYICIMISEPVNFLYFHAFCYNDSSTLVEQYNDISQTA